MDGIERTVSGLEETLAAEREYLARTEKRMEDLKAEVARPFDKAERLAWLQERQKQLDAMLELTKGELAAADEEEQ